MDLVPDDTRIVSAWWPPAGRSAPGYGAPERDLSRTSRRCFASTGRGRTGPPISSSRTQPRRRTSRRRHSSSALRNLDRFDRRRPFGPWLHRIVVNRAIDWARARTLRRELSEVPGSEDFDTGDLGTFSEGVAAGLAGLAPDQRAVIVLRYLLEYTPGEIADLLDLPRGTVNSRLRRGLDRLEAIVDREQR